MKTHKSIKGELYVLFQMGSFRAFVRKPVAVAFWQQWKRYGMLIGSKHATPIIDAISAELSASGDISLI